jgi:primosomal protein N' (replication factor Y)
VDGAAGTLTEVLQLLRPPEPTEVLGPVPLAGVTLSGTEDAVERLTLRTPLTGGSALVAALKDVTAVRSAKKSDGAQRVRVDPVVLG